jgi:hypothetical protein
VTVENAAQRGAAAGNVERAAAGEIGKEGG